MVCVCVCVRVYGQYVETMCIVLISLSCGVQVGFGAGCGANNREKIGPELGFGYGMSQALAPGEKFLIMKNAWGGKTIAIDFRPPTSAASDDP